MIDTIKKLLADKPRHAVRMITLRPELWAWVMDHCDPTCLDNASRIYTAITGEKAVCPCGSGKIRKLNSMAEGFFFCGRANACEAAREAVSEHCRIAAQSWDKEAAKEKRAATNLEKYGVENAGQSVAALLAHKELYADKDKVSAILDKMQATCLATYNVRNPQQDPDIHNRTIQTLIREYGVKNLRQIHIGAEAMDILQDPNKLTQFLSTHSIVEVCKVLNVSRVTLFKYHNALGLNIISQEKSKYETEIDVFLTELKVAHTQGNRKLLGGKELDFVIPDYNLAIEFDGLYWHSESSPNARDKNYHNDKRRACQKLGINLLHIFQDEWIESADICKSIIRQHLRLGNRIAARKCEVSEVPNLELKEFLDTNHLQGWVNGTHAYVLKYEDEIVAAMTFGKPRYNKQAEWELLRLAFRNDTIVMGGSEKLWKFAVDQLQATSIVSYCDKRWFTGAVYEKLGFTLKTVGKPTYWYTDYTTRWHRTKFTKKNLLKMSQDKDINPTQEDWSSYSESQITKDILGLDRIWDCGQDSWFWTK